MMTLPEPQLMRRRFQSLAMLDAIVSEFSEDRYYFYEHSASGSDFARMDNGSGDNFHILFSNDGTVVQGFSHESTLSPFELDPPRPFPGIIDELPSRFVTELRDKGVEIVHTTFCYWRHAEDGDWKHGSSGFARDSVASGAEELLEILDGRLESYKEFADYYYEKSLDIESIQRMYRFEPMNMVLAESLIGGIDWAQTVREAGRVGYPIEKSGKA